MIGFLLIVSNEPRDGHAQASTMACATAIGFQSGRQLLMAVDKIVESALLRRGLCDLLMVVHALLLTTLLFESNSYSVETHRAKNISVLSDSILSSFEAWLRNQPYTYSHQWRKFTREGRAWMS
jgi:hypothetical protein